MTMRPVRNNNPGDLRYNASNHWPNRMPPKQMNAAQQGEQSFEVFETMRAGFRNCAVVLINYQFEDALSIEQMVPKFAPGSDGNFVEEYIDDVVAQSRFPRGQRLDFNANLVLVRVVKGFSYVEASRTWPYNDNDLANGVADALRDHPPMYV